MRANYICRNMLEYAHSAGLICYYIRGCKTYKNAHIPQCYVCHFELLQWFFETNEMKQKNTTSNEIKKNHNIEIFL